jgi:hypothetical protein
MTTCIVVGCYQNLNHRTLSVYKNIFLVKHVVILSVIRPLISPTESLFYEYVFQQS